MRIQRVKVVMRMWQSQNGWLWELVSNKWEVYLPSSLYCNIEPLQQIYYVSESLTVLTVLFCLLLAAFFLNKNQLCVRSFYYLWPYDIGLMVYTCTVQLSVCDQTTCYCTEKARRLGVRVWTLGLSASLLAEVWLRLRRHRCIEFLYQTPFGMNGRRCSWSLLASRLATTSLVATISAVIFFF